MNLNLYDADLNRIAIIGEQYISCLWSEGYNTIENFTLELVETDEYKKKVSVDCYVGRSDRNTLMVIKTVQISGGKIVASGKQATRVLDDVPFVGTIPSGVDIDTSVINAYNESEKYRNVEFYSTSLGVKYNHQISNKSFSELCEIMAQEENVGFRSIRKNGIVYIEFYQPEESEKLVFSEKFGNLTVDSVTISSENYKNYAVVLGAGEGDNRTRVFVDLTNGDERRSLIVDAKDLQLEDGETIDNYKERLVSRGVETLLERTKTFYCAFSPYASDFGEKYDLGDILTIYLTDYGITIKARVVKFTQKSQENKTETTIQVGQTTIKR